MIRINLLLVEYMYGKGNRANEGKLKAIHSIKELLSQIDFNAEVIPEDNIERFTCLLTSLKGQPLNNDETELAEEIVNYRQEPKD